MSALENPDAFEPYRGKNAISPNAKADLLREIRRSRPDGLARSWLGGDPIGSAWWTALSATFPRGEAFFIETINKFRDGASAQLSDDIRKFVRQEANHSQEHIAFNRLAEGAGYDLSGIDGRMAALIMERRASKDIVNLATTASLEHFTAIIGTQLLSNPAHLAGTEPGDMAIWLWHAEEEIDHKGVAYDTWLHATAQWSAWKCWKVRSLVMLYVTWLFFSNRIRDTLELLQQQGITGKSAKWQLAKYLLGKPGLLRCMFPRWCSFFLPGFHPWKHDDSALLENGISNFSKALKLAK